MAGTTAFLPWARAVSLNQPVCFCRLPPPPCGLVRTSCLGLLTWTGERKVPSLPPIPHKHFRAMQGRKLCLAFPLHPLPLSDLPPFQLSELISAREIFHFCSQPYWDQTGINPRQTGSLGSCKTRTDPPFCPFVSGGWAEAVTYCPLTPTPHPPPPTPSNSAREPGWAQGKQKVHAVCSVSMCN